MAFLSSIRRFDHQKISDYSDVKQSENSENPIFFFEFSNRVFFYAQNIFSIFLRFYFIRLKFKKIHDFLIFNTPGTTMRENVTKSLRVGFNHVVSLRLQKFFLTLLFHIPILSEKLYFIDQRPRFVSIIQIKCKNPQNLLFYGKFEVLNFLRLVSHSLILKH